MNNVCSPSLDSVEAGAPVSVYGDYGGDLCAEPPCGIVVEIGPFRQSLESIYYDWWAENDHLLSMGLPGDVLELRERLNAAFAKVSNCAVVAPREAQNAAIAASKSIT